MKKKVIVVAFAISLVVNFILLLPYVEIEEKVLENNRINRDKTYAIMVQNEDKTGYIENTSNIFPSDMTLNEELTNCTDENGTKVENALTYEEGNIIVETNKKIYCYLYFDANASFGNQLLQNPTRGLNTTLEGGLYRYQGTNVDNYICFGTSDKDECLNNTDAHIYRIIGISEDGRIKVLKIKALNSSYSWHRDKSSNIMWGDSDLYKGLNGISGGYYSNLFIGNTSYIPSGWEDKIEMTTWKYGDNTSVNVTADALYNIENAWGNTIKAKIGLIYAHDYYYAYQSGGLNCSGGGQYSTCKTSWMFITGQYEWTMSRYGLNSSYYHAWILGASGNIYSENLSGMTSVRPVFFLSSTVQFEGGTGTSSDPFIIS